MDWLFAAHSYSPIDCHSVEGSLEVLLSLNFDLKLENEYGREFVFPEN